MINDAFNAVASTRIPSMLKNLAMGTGTAICLVGRGASFTTFSQTTGIGTMLVLGSPDPQIVARRQELAVSLAPWRAMSVVFTIFCLADCWHAALDLMLALDLTASRTERYEGAVCAVVNSTMAAFSAIVVVHATPRVTFEQRHFYLARCSMAGKCGVFTKSTRAHQIYMHPNWASQYCRHARTQCLCSAP